VIILLIGKTIEGLKLLFNHSKPPILELKNIMKKLNHKLMISIVIVSLAVLATSCATSKQYPKPANCSAVCPF